MDLKLLQPTRQLVKMNQIYVVQKMKLIKNVQITVRTGTNVFEIVLTCHRMSLMKVNNYQTLPHSYLKKLNVLKENFVAKGLKNPLWKKNPI